MALQQELQPARRFFPVMLGMTFLVGLVVRVYDLDARQMGHPENSVPGIIYPAFVGWVRVDLVSLLKTVIYQDGHPPMYFLGMLAWVKLFGTSLWSFRLPSAICGALSVWLLYRVGLREVGRWTALMAAGLLALNGHHLFWSQQSRMYMLASFLALLSTLLLLRLLERGRSRDAWAYFAASVLGVWTHLFYWPVLLVQMAFTFADAIRERRPPIALSVQAAAFIVACPVLSLMLTQNLEHEFFDPRFEYFGFGYLFFSMANFPDPPSLPFDRNWLSALGFGLLALGALAGSRRFTEVFTDRHISPRVTSRVLFGLAVATAAAMGVFAFALGQRDTTLIYAVPFLPIGLAAAAVIAQPRLVALATRPPSWLSALANAAPRVSLWLALFPWLFWVAVSEVRPVFIARGLAIYLPFVTLAIASGVAQLAALANRWLAVLLAAALLTLHAGSVAYSHQAWGSPFDYRGLAQAMHRHLLPGDLVFVELDWATPPLYHYLEVSDDRLIPSAYFRVLQQTDFKRRVWVVSWYTSAVERQDRRVRILAHSGYRLTRIELTKYGAFAHLFLPPGAPDLPDSSLPSD